MIKKNILILTVLMSISSTVLAAHFGLGNAVANQGSDVLDKAAPNLPSCGSEFTLFNQAPVTDPNVVGVIPLGHMFPPGHTFPSDHMYFNYNEALPNLNTNLYAPSNGWVVSVTKNDLSSGAPFGINPNYYVAFSPCREVTLNFLEVATLSSKLTDALTAPNTHTRCSSFNSGGLNPEAGETCVTRTQIPFVAGEILATGLVSDFGPLEDSRVSLSGFANPSRHNLHRGFCPLDYFTADVQALYIPGVNNGSTLIPRTIAPLCGTIVQDIAGTAQGDWYAVGAPSMPDNPHLALIHDNVYPSTAAFSVGTSILGFDGVSYIFQKTTPDGSLINYDFSLISDQQIYCFDSFKAFPTGGTLPNLSGRIALVQLTDATLTNLRIELQNPTTDCATASPWAFTPAAVIFER